MSDNTYYVQCNLFPEVRGRLHNQPSNHNLTLFPLRASYHLD